MTLFSISEVHLLEWNELGRSCLALVLALSLGSCSSRAAMEVDLAGPETERVAAEQEVARIAQEQERVRALELDRQREAQVIERARLQAERDRQVIEARNEEEQRRQDEAERREQARLAEIEAAEAEEIERRVKLARISSLEQQITMIQAEASRDEVASAILQEAILVAEELLQILIAEQSKYENTDSNGNTVNPLSKDLIAELEARKNELVRQSQSQ